MQYNQSEFLLETTVPEGELIISRTDLNGVVTYANEAFCEISGYTEDELVGKPHNIVRHPDMPKTIFEEMWKDLGEKTRWSGVVKNMRKDGGFYWVHALVSGVYKNGELVEYKSQRSPISFEEKVKYQKHYDALRAQHGEAQRVITYQ